MKNLKTPNHLKHIILATASTLFLIGSVTAAPATTSVTEKPILITQKQKTFTIKLKANPTTGYNWFVESYNDDAFRLRKYTFQAPSKTTKKGDEKALVGAPGEAQFVFSVKSSFKRFPRSESIHFIYAKAWENGGTEKVVTVRSAG